MRLFTRNEGQIFGSRGIIITLAMILLMVPAVAFAGAGGENYVPAVYKTAWALLPPVVAIGLALITKEVFSSLFVGIAIGAVLYSGGNFEVTMNHIFQDGMVSVLSDSYNVGILIFLVILGIMVSLMNKTGGSRAFAEYTKTKIKSRVGAQLATVLLGIMIFVDDYFNCLTVGSVMRPVADSHNVSRAKLAYLIDSTAAPICIIAPISSWAAAVAGFVEGQDGITIFVKAIPYNFYALLTLVMVFALVITNVDYGPMRKHEVNALAGDLFTTGENEYSNSVEEEVTGNGSVLDLVVPIILLIISCIVGLIYTGGFFSGTSFVESFSGCDAPVGLVLGSFSAFVLTIVFYVSRRVIKFRECMDCIPEGFKAMVPAIMILTLAWSLKAMTDSLGAAKFVEALVKSNAAGLMSFLPAIIFIIACLLAFATGTSWGTFGILIPIVVPIFQGLDDTMMIIAISACMAGAVCGDHCSPISDTTIMASAGSQCNHVNHVSTQLPYAITVAVITFIAYLVAGFTKTPIISLALGVVMIIGMLLFIKKRQQRSA